MPHASVVAAWRAFTAPLEGVCSWMYLDVEGLVTTGMGNLIDGRALLPGGTIDEVRSAAPALDLPWRRHIDGQLAAPAEIRAEWSAVKHAAHLAAAGAAAARDLGRLYLDDAAIDALIEKSLEATAARLGVHFPAFESWPADAQLGLLSMGYAMGPDFPRRWPRFTSACLALDFDAAADSCMMDACAQRGSEGARNALDQYCFRNAAAQLRAGADPSVLVWRPTLAALS